MVVNRLHYFLGTIKNYLLRDILQSTISVVISGKKLIQLELEHLLKQPHTDLDKQIIQHKQ